MFFTAPSSLDKSTVSTEGEKIMLNVMKDDNDDFYDERALWHLQPSFIPWREDGEEEVRLLEEDLLL